VFFSEHSVYVLSGKVGHNDNIDSKIMITLIALLY